MNPVMDFSAIMTEAITPVLAAIEAQVAQLGTTMEEVSAEMTAAFDEASSAATAYSAALVEATAAVDENTAASDANTASHQAAPDSTGALGNNMSALMGPLAIVTGGLAASAVGALVMQGKFESAMSVVQAFADQSTPDIQMFTKQILDMSDKTGVAATNLAGGLYYILSAQIPVKDAMGVLKVVTEASAAGMVDASTDANALTTALNSYGQGASQAEHYQDLLITTVKDGKTTMEQYAGAIGKAASMGSEVGVSFEQVNAAWATLTLSGVSAKQASLDLTNTFKVLDLSTDSLAKRAKSLGIDFDESKFKTMSLADQFSYLEKATGGSATKLYALLNNKNAFEAFSKIMEDGGKHMSDILTDMKNSAGMTANAWTIHTHTMGYQWDLLKTNFENALINMGHALEPFAEEIMAKIVPALSSFASWVTAHGPEMAAIIGGLGVAFGSLLVAVVAVGPIGKTLGTAFDVLRGAGSSLFSVIGNGGGVFARLGSAGLSAGRNLFDMQLRGMQLSEFFTSSLPSAIERVHGALLSGIEGGFNMAGSALGKFADALVSVGDINFVSFFKTITSGSTYLNILRGGMTGLWGVIEAGLPALAGLAGSMLAVLVPLLLIAGAIVIGVVIFTQFRAQLMQVVDFLAASVRPEFDAMKKAIHDALETIESKWQQVWPQLKPAVEQLIQSLRGLAPWFQIIATAVSLAFRIIITILAAVVGAFISALPAITHVLTGVITIISAVGAIVQDIFERKFGDIPAQIGRIFGAIWQIISNALGMVITFITSFIGNVISGFTHLWSELVGHSIIPDMVNAVVQWFLKLPAQIIGMIATFVANLIARFVSLEIQGIALVVSLVSNIVTTIAALPGKALTLIGQVIASITSAFTDGVGTVVGGVGSLVSGIVGALASLPGKFLDVARNCVNSFANEIKNIPVVGGVVGFAGNVVGGIGNALGIHSPSKVFADIAGYSVDGFVQGLQNHSARAANSTARLGTVIASAFNPALAGGASALIGSNSASAYARSSASAVNGPMPPLQIHLTGTGWSLLDPQQQDEIARGVVQRVTRMRNVQGNALTSYPGR